jgi:aryl-alcohol dehydrogenase-like predicted oxidoreductase
MTGTIKSRDDFNEGDMRLYQPRFSNEHFDQNLKLGQTLAAIAEKKGATPAQLVLAWVLAQGHDFIPIPGTKHREYLKQNAKAIDVKISNTDEKDIREAIERAGGGKGARYPPAMMSMCFGDNLDLKK